MTVKPLHCAQGKGVDFAIIPQSFAFSTNICCDPSENCLNEAVLKQGPQYINLEEMKIVPKLQQNHFPP